MRISKYLVNRNISLKTLNYICEYLNFDFVNLNTKISEEKVKLFDFHLDNSVFTEWFKIRITLDKIKIDNAYDLVKKLDQNVLIDDLLGERILNACAFLTKLSFYSSERREAISIILNSENSISEKIKLLKISKKQKDKVKENEEVIQSFSTYENDPYEDFCWGGLSGEEAYDGYWNTE